MAANTHLYRQQSSADNKKKGTYSIWIKRSLLSSNQYIIGNYNDSTNYGFIRFDSTDQIRVNSVDAGSTTYEVITNRKFRDTSAWYHIVVRIDTANATQADRVRVYVNGEEETFSSSTIGNNTNHGLFFNSTSTGHRIASQDSVTNQRHDGLMAHIHYSDGYSYAPTEFGETDSTTGQWKINVNPSISYGSQGYFMFKDDASINDQSGNGNNFTAGGGGAPTPTVDNPSNVFATMNSLNGAAGSDYTLTNGNTTFGRTSSGNRAGFATLGVQTGKWYWEVEASAIGGGAYIGISKESNTYNSQQGNSQYTGSESGDIGYKSSDGNKVIGATSTSYGNSYTTGDIIGVALDLDNDKLYFSKNGTWQNSGVPTSGSTGTGAISITNSDYVWFPSSSGQTNVVLDHNFGNGYFGTTAISSEGTNASGIGKFEYDVPTGYTALSTKGLNE